MPLQKQIKNRFWKPATETRNKDYTLLDFSLGRITFLNTLEKQKVYDYLLSLENDGIDPCVKLSEMTVPEISSVIGRNLTGRIDWKGNSNFKAAQKELETCRILKIGFLRYSEFRYPAMLKTITNPPYLLFYRGNLDAFNAKSVSVVGTRQITPGGKKAAYDFAYDACKAGVTVVSGLARGVDGFAHKGACEAYLDALDKNEDTGKIGKTVAVLPASIDNIVPSIHKNLAQNILNAGGCLVSEYAPMSGIAQWLYVKRNRIIAALSPATVVIEAPNASGSLITVDFALELGRDVMFHENCFSENAKKINEAVKKELEIKFTEKKITKAKMETSAEKFVSEGAPVIKNYEDYCRALVEEPGVRQNKNMQLELNI